MEQSDTERSNSFGKLSSAEKGNIPPAQYKQLLACRGRA